MSNSQNPIRILASAQAAPIIARELSRRRFFTLTALAGGAAALAACSPGGTSTQTSAATGGELEDSVSVYTWGDYDSPDVMKAFTTELGPQVKLDSFSSNEELISKLVAAKGTSGYDIIVPTGVFIPQMIENKIVQKLNLDLIPNITSMDPAFLKRSWDPNNEYSICKAWGTTGFVYDKTVINRELTTWADFIDAAQNEASGKTSLIDDPAEVLGLYFWANGIDWTTTDTADLDACEDFLVNSMAPHVSAFDSYPGGQAIPQATQVLMQSWNGDARLGFINSDEPDRWQWVLAGPVTELWMDNWAIPDGAPHPEAAHAFINYMIAPENQVDQVDYIGYHTGVGGIETACEEAGLEMLDMVFFTPEQLATMEDYKLTEAQQRRVEIWNSAKAAAGA